MAHNHARLLLVVRLSLMMPLVIELIISTSPHLIIALLIASSHPIVTLLIHHMMTTIATTSPATNLIIELRVAHTIHSIRARATTRVMPTTPSSWRHSLRSVF